MIFIYMTIANPRKFDNNDIIRNCSILIELIKWVTENRIKV